MLQDLELNDGKERDEIIMAPEGAADDQDDASSVSLDEDFYALTDAVKTKTKGRKEQTGGKRSVIFVGHIPFGFFEPQMKAFFSQFGTVTRIKLHRNPRTGHSRHNAYVEFADEHIAQDVAKAMDNYIMYERRLVCKVVPPEKVRPRMFFGAVRQSPEQRKAIVSARLSVARSTQQHGKLVQSIAARQKQRQERLASMGIDYVFGEAGPRPLKAAAKPVTPTKPPTPAKSPKKPQTSPVQSSHAAIGKHAAKTPKKTPAKK
ncbi:putative FHA domain-interacting nucleolar phosphoprotein [Paratrimastix pyriformis]|uniref:FHA domain-interacting nucleolar phosphoprotein n=1 Tax=Paratrimastix pyriformis TaxID=342808 RepID=A0ABQ8UUE3_9EUKA|nr:putative FHA domain-interacting nucleolar phosphoprotein [Paratrimastix pyriformis]